MRDKPYKFSEEEMQQFVAAGVLEPSSRFHRGYQEIYFYTDTDNDDFPSLFEAYSHHPSLSDNHYEIAKKAFEVVLLGLS